MNFSSGMYNIWLRYVENLTAETLLDCHMHSVKFPSHGDPNDDVDISSGDRRFSIWSRGTEHTFRGPEWSRMLSPHEDGQLSRHINPTVLSDFERLVIL